MKKIYRIKYNGKIAGICSGIADMFNLDPNVIRLIVVFLTVVTALWPAVITYLVGWWLIPEKSEIVN